MGTPGTVLFQDVIEPVGANNTVEIDANVPADDNTAWHHIVLQRAGDIMECWLDGTRLCKACLATEKCPLAKWEAA